MQNEKIKFKPLHEGIGFHPFSEGLPYAPQVKSEPNKPRTNTSIASKELPRTSTPAGATSAGIPSFSIPSMPKTSRQLRAQANPLTGVASTHSKSHQTIIPGKDFEANREADLRTRSFAYLLDTVVHLSFWIAISLIATLGLHLDIDGALIANNALGFASFFVFSQWFFIAMQETLFETSFGKSFFGLEFKRNRKNFITSSLFIRSIVFMIGSLTLIGFFFRPQDHFAEVQHQKK